MPDWNSELCLIWAGLLCVWLHAAGVHHPGDCYGVRDHCGHLLLAQCGELPLAMDILQCSCFHIPVGPLPIPIDIHALKKMMLSGVGVCR